MIFMVCDIRLSDFHFNLVFIHVLLYEWFRIFYVYFTKYALCMFLNYVFFMHFGHFDVAKGGEKNGYFRDQDIIFSKL